MSGLPRRPRGRQSAEAVARYDGEVAAFCDRLLQIRSRLDFKVGTRGWCYLLESERVIDKGDFDDAERFITACRKSGALPVDFCAADDKRAADGVEYLDNPDIDEQANEVVSYISRAHRHYTPISFWDDLEVYVEIAVEKSDLKSLFASIAEEFHVVIQNVGGWADLNVRVGMMRRFAEWEARGKRCILLYCGDHDPGGLQISDYLRENLEELAVAVGWSPVNLVISRFGLHHRFIEAHGLTWIDNLETGSGKRLDDQTHPEHKKGYVQDYLARFGARKVEANALVARPEAGRQLCRDAILSYVPEGAIADYEMKIETCRDELRQAVDRLVGTL